MSRVMAPGREACGIMAVRQARAEVNGAPCLGSRLGKRLLALVLFVLALLAAGCATENVTRQLPAFAMAPPLLADTDYLLQPGDIMDIKLYYNKELNEQVKIRPDGKIALQLVEEVKAAGVTTAQLRELLTQRYAQKLRQPEVAVILKEWASQKVFVGGEVNAPGLVTYTGNLTALQAIFQAGGLKNTAELSTVVILRNRPGDVPLFMTRDLKRDLAGEEERNDLLLMPYDVVFLPKTTIAKMNLFVDQYIEKLFPISKNLGFSYVYNLNPSVSVK